MPHIFSEVRIDCDFEEKGSFIYSVPDRKKLDDELRILDSLSYPAELVNTLPLPFRTVLRKQFFVNLGETVSSFIFPTVRK